MSHRARRNPWVGTALVLLAAAAFAQEQESVPPPRADGAVEQQGPMEFGETINVRIVNVDVFVTDKKGNPVTGLRRDDFELYEAKRPIAISNFYEYREGDEVRDEPEPEEPVAPTPRTREDLFTSHPGLQKSTVPEDQRLSLVVYVDHFNLTPNDRNRVFRYLRQFLRTKLDREDRVALLSYNRSVKIERPFTTDSSLIADATYELEKHTGGRTTAESERMDILRELNRDRIYYYQLIGRVRLHAENVLNDLEFTLDGLRETIQQLGGIPGRKALLYVSNGLQMRAAEDLFWAMDERFKGDEQQSPDAENALMEIFQFDASRRFDEIGRIANANRVTLYTMDAAGLRIGGMRSAEFEGSQMSSTIDSVYTNNLLDSIMYLADRTGGQAIVNTNNMTGGLNKISSDFQNRYSLGFSPSHGGSNRSYKLDVRVKKEIGKAIGRKLVVRFRDSYVDKPVAQEMGDATLAALTFGFQSNPLGATFDVQRGPDGQIQRDDGNYLVSFEVRVPLSNVTLLPAGNDYQAQVSAFIQVIDEKDKTSAVQENPFTILVKGDELDEARRLHYTYVLKLLMEEGEHIVAVAVRDSIAGEASFLTESILVGG